MRQDAKHKLIQCENIACRKREADGNTKFSKCASCRISVYCSKSCQRAHWGRHKQDCKRDRASLQNVAAETAVNLISDNGQVISITMENISPLCEDFLVNYRALLNLSMFNAFGWTTPHLPHTARGPRCFCEARQDHKILFITLRVAPKLSLATKGRAAFLVEDAEALDLAEFLEASCNTRHRLFLPGHVPDTFDPETEEFGGVQKRMPRESMCIMKFILESAVILQSFHTWDDRSNDYSSRWNPNDWLQHLKQEVAKGKGWEPPYDPFKLPPNPHDSAQCELEG
ncbi:hypothetical protein FIBSPDRAFT_1042021 [Athelia psychrophila]|uniref:MYND-type domain-containing protein n=1 Tax=Athelia psychrophila TaxID=1759441 RepID=A0A166N1G5_9AGAM|nr:hypothetical protein FIBSPDRAFT_1054736 [Fibularhizoctonia sp. CBS 109695]KZP24548.1 hypothetical protein FIBSPDRAFT_1042021 [Fibularhizoctonia sp. CBS 109695]